MTTLYLEYLRNLKSTYELVGEEYVDIPAKININDVAFSVALMSIEYIPDPNDTEIDYNHIIDSFPEFLVNNELQVYSMSQIIDKAKEKMQELADDAQKKVVGFLVYCEAGLCFYEPIN